MAGIRAATPTIRDLGNTMGYAAHSTGVLTTAMTTGSNASRVTAARALEARSRVAEFGKAAAPAAAAAAGMAIAMTGLGDELGITNTATFGLTGTLGGPWASPQASPLERWST